MVAKPVQFDTFSWPTKSAAMAEFSAVLNSYSIGDRITDPDHERLLYEALDRHPHGAQKVGDGIDYFYVGATSQDKAARVRKDAKGFWIQRLDGSPEDFSYKSAIDGASPKIDAKDALRQAVLLELQLYKADRFAAGTAVSDLTGAPLTDDETTWVIYLTPDWGQLTYRFAELHGGWTALAVDPGTAQVGGRLADPALETEWLNFHASHANLGLARGSEAVRRPRTDESSWVP